MNKVSEAMDDTVKHRMIGAALFFTLATIFVPMLFEESLEPTQRPALQSVPIPEAPATLNPDDSFAEPAKRAPRIVELPLLDDSKKPAGNSQSWTPTTPNTPSVPKPEQAVTAPTKATDGPSSSKNPAPADAWMIQVGSFSSEINARALVNELQKARFKAFVEQIQSSNGSLYRVGVGPESSRQNAEAIRSRILQQLGMKTIVKPYVN